MCSRYQGKVGALAQSFGTATNTNAAARPRTCLQHNVVGRTTYAEGSVDACLFLAAQVCVCVCRPALAVVHQGSWGRKLIPRRVQG